MDDIPELFRRSGYLNMEQLRASMETMFPPRPKPAAVYRPHMVPTPQPTIRLPADVIGIIAEHLSTSYSYGTLATLNRTCKLVRDETLPILFETVTWDNAYDGPQREWWWEPLRGKNGTVYEFPEGWRYIKVMYFERDQLRSWSPVASSHVDVFPLLRFMILRQLEYKHDDCLRKQHQYSARVTITTFLQPSVSFAVSLFGIKSHASILDMPLKVQQDYQSRNQPVVSGIQYVEDLEPVHFAPKAFLTRSGRMSEDLELNNKHKFNGTHFGIGFQPPVTAANTRQIEETLEEIIILLPSDRQRMSLHLKFYDPALNQCVHQAIVNMLPRHFRSLDFRFENPITPNELVTLLITFSGMFAEHWSAVQPFTTPESASSPSHSQRTFPVELPRRERIVISWRAVSGRKRQDSSS